MDGCNGFRAGCPGIPGTAPEPTETYQTRTDAEVTFRLSCRGTSGLEKLSQIGAAGWVFRESDDYGDRLVLDWEISGCACAGEGQVYGAPVVVPIPIQIDGTLGSRERRAICQWPHLRWEMKLLLLSRFIGAVPDFLDTLKADSRAAIRIAYINDASKPLGDAR